jgi:hypothetical protein
MSAETDAWKLREISKTLEEFEEARNDPGKTSEDIASYAFFHLGRIAGLLSVPEDQAIERMAREAG